MNLIPNSAAKRFEYIAKLYGDRHPDVVLDTFMVLSDTVGIESPWSEWKWARNWDNLPIGARGSSGHSQKLWLFEARRDLATDPRMQRRRPSDALWPWLARELVALQKRDAKTDNGRPLGAVLAVTDRREGGLRGAASALALWQQQNRINLGEWSLADALAALEEFNVERKVIPQGEVAYEWPDGWTMQLLLPPHELLDESEREYEDALEQMLVIEGDVMQHCVGGLGYLERALYNHMEIYSLRDPKGRPHVTVAVSTDVKRILQVQGKQNRAPLPEYQARVDEWKSREGLLGLHELATWEKDAAEEFGTAMALERMEEYLAREHTSVWGLSWSDVEVLGSNFLHGQETDLLEHVYGGEPAERITSDEALEPLKHELWKAARRAAAREYSERRSELLDQLFTIARQIEDTARPLIESDTWGVPQVQEHLDRELASLGAPWGASDFEHIERDVWRLLSDVLDAQRDRENDG